MISFQNFLKIIIIAITLICWYMIILASCFSNLKYLRKAIFLISQFFNNFQQGIRILFILISFLLHIGNSFFIISYKHLKLFIVIITYYIFLHIIFNFFAFRPNLIVEIVCSIWEMQGFTHNTIAVRELPPNELLKIFVSGQFR